MTNLCRSTSQEDRVYCEGHTVKERAPTSHTVCTNERTGNISAKALCIARHNLPRNELGLFLGAFFFIFRYRNYNKTKVNYNEKRRRRRRRKTDYYDSVILC